MKNRYENAKANILPMLLSTILCFSTIVTLLGAGVPWICPSSTRATDSNGVAAAWKIVNVAAKMLTRNFLMADLLNCKIMSECETIKWYDYLNSILNEHTLKNNSLENITLPIVSIFDQVVSGMISADTWSKTA